MASRTFAHSSSSESQPRVWVIVPAAGIGGRMRSDRPKPYLCLGSRQLIDVTLERLLSADKVGRIRLALHPQDRWWADTESARSNRILPYTGGAERDDSVRAGLDQIRPLAAPEDWVLVHDVARPCIDVADIKTLMAAIARDPVGGLLAAPVVDTIKQVGEDGRVDGTADRTRLWRALTPQVFRFQILDRALKHARESGIRVTDEASAVEALGLRPQLVAGRSDNIKVTTPEDLSLAAWFLGLS